uniref:Uncharacterized protein n=1 Tax=Ursus americanus TaxID=9643 RepID=A0A452RLA1_URSAM
MSRRKSEWTGFAITCSPCTATTPPRSCMRPSRSCSRMWGTPRWYMAGRVATSTSGCPCWMSRPNLSPPSPALQNHGVLGEPGAYSLRLPSPLALTRLPLLGTGSPLLPSVPGSASLPWPGLQSLVGRAFHRSPGLSFSCPVGRVVGDSFLGTTSLLSPPQPGFGFVSMVTGPNV